MKVAVTGAFSYTGKYIAARLLERGSQVITLTNHMRRPDPFAGKVKAFPYDFESLDRLAEHLAGSQVLVNTYWVRFDRGSDTQARAMENTHIMIQAALRAGVRRIVHISITNPSLDSSLPYFRGKAALEHMVVESGVSYAILRPTLIFGREDILINNIAWVLRRFPFFLQIGNGLYKVQPVYVDDLAESACQSVHAAGNTVYDVVGPETYTFDALVSEIGKAIRHPRPVLHSPPGVALAFARLISLFTGDVMLTQDEVQGLMAGLLVSSDLPKGNTRLSAWMQANRDSLGSRYASEVARHYR